MKILVIEDEVKTATFVQKGLSEHGFIVDIARDGEEGLSQALAQNYDLLIVDVMMPKMDGFALVENLRRRQSASLVLFLTARDSLADRVHGLNIGADAYLPKPFAFTELLALVRSLLRRGLGARAGDSIKIADLEIDFLKHTAVRGGKRLDLTPKEFSLLSLLARKTGDVISRAMIADQVWNIDFDSETNVVDVHIARLRGKVDGPHSRKLIHTVRGMGYVLRADG
jgi:two-component system copper resistance phosphate regulon response regulator CusR